MGIDTVNAAEQDTDPLPTTTLAQRLLRALAPVLVTTLTLQPLTLYAAPSPSLLAQSPKLLDTSVPANVVFLMDDSLSMDDIRLPVPPGLNPNESTGGQVTVRGQATGYATNSGAWTVSSAISAERVNEWIFRSAVLNPLYYNPSIVYRPWNDNGRDGANGSFTNAGVGSTAQVTDGSNNFRFSLTRQDMRYAGPNYTFGNQNNFTSRNAVQGSNPAAVPAYLQAARPANGGFTGAVDAQNRNQDLFTSVMVLANGGAQQCLAPPQNPLTTPQPTTSRDSIPRPTVQRTVVARASTAQLTASRALTPRSNQASTTSTRDVLPRTSSPQPTTAAIVGIRSNITRTTQTLAATTTPTFTSRPGTAQATSTRTASARPSTAQTVTTRASSALPATTSRTTSTRPSTPQGTGSRAITPRPSSAQLTSTRQTYTAPMEYRQETGVCGGGAWTAWSTTSPSRNFCSDPSSEAGVRVASIQNRYQPCQSGYTASGSQCISNCPTGYSVNPVNSNQCIQDCPSGVVANGVCYGTCPAGTTVYASNNQQCIADCPTGTTVSGTQCLSGCPTGTDLINGQCYTGCATGSTINGTASTSTQCISYCGAGTTTTATQCVGTCPTGYTASGSICYQNCATGTYQNPTNVAQCLSNCASGVTNNGLCYSACPTGTSIDGSNAYQCLSNCPTGWTASGNQCLQNCATGTNLISGICYGACPTGTTLNGTAATATQCYTNCPTGSTFSGGQCVGTCNTGFTNISDTCYSNCPTGSVQNPGDVGQCLSNCATGTVISASNSLQCVSCSSGTLSNTASGASCLQNCLTGSTLIGGLCYQNSCPINYAYNGAVGTATTCIANCPAFSTINATTCTNCTALFPTLIGSACYANCPTGSTIHTDSTQCVANCPSGYSVDPANNLQCLGSCTAGATLIAGQCYAATCSAGYSLNGPSATATQCISDCPTGYSVDPVNPSQCVAACPAAYPNLVGTTCYANCPSGYSVNGSNQAQCLGSCPTGYTLNGGTCSTCPSGTSPFGTNQCCPSNQLTQGNCPLNRPAGSDCSAGKWVPDFSQGTPARYYVFAPASAIASPSNAQLSDPGNYVQVRIDRDLQMNFPRASTRTDCANAATPSSPGYCTWAEEAQNFANWYTYYRTRLFSAIGVTSASLSGLTADKGLDTLRLGYGSINYFPEGANPYPNFNPLLNSRLPSTMTVDGQASNGALVRGVRPFQQLASTPPNPGSNDRRQEVFDWLFSLRAVAATPNREALDSVGRYFKRTDNRGPWIRPTTANETSNWQTSESADSHISCRRNFTILVTDGEWTRAPYVTGAPQQPLVENTDTTLATLSGSGPQLTGFAGRNYQYTPANEPQWSTNASSAGGTLSDIAFYYWSRDLRPDLPNNVRPVDPTEARQGDPAFWQHLVPYIVGYGISASMDTSATRQAVIAAARGARTPISWPNVRLEDRSTEVATIITDRDAAPINCGYDPATNPSGCGRVNDTLRAALSARGDFLSATDVSGLAAGIASAFTAIGQITGSSTALTGRSGTVRQGDRLFLATFQTNVWSGRLQSFDALAYYNALGGTALAAGIAQRFPAPASRNVVTSVSLAAGGAAFPSSDADFTTLTAGQRTALGNDSFVPQWLRGDQSRDGAGYRKRAAGEILGDIVNSQPLYSHFTDNGYSSGRAPAAAGSNASTYPQYVRDNREYRPARVFVGANDGMLHAFDASGTPSTNGNYMNETFAYVPRSVYGTLATLASPDYLHLYTVDGPIIEGDVFINGAWRSVLVGTTGAGPKGVFALDVTQRTGMTARTMGATDVMWDLAPALDGAVSGMDDVGNIVQPGVIGSGRDGEWYYFVGNGYESANDKAKLLAIRIRDGAIFPIATDSEGGNNPSSGSVSNQPNGLGGVTPIYDGNRNVVAIYAGDRLGRLWKFDLSSANRNDWASATGTTPLFVASAPDGVRQSVAAAPRVAAHPLGGRMIVFGTGKVFENNDLLDMTVQAVYGVWEKNLSSPAAVAKTSLRQLTLADVTDPVTQAKYRQLQGTTSLNWNTDLGWYLNLTTGTAYGERVVASPTENFGFVNVTSFEPAANGDPCVGGGRSFFYRLDISGSFTRAPFAPAGLNNLDAGIPRNTLIGAELEGPTVSGVQTLLRPVDGTAAVSSTLTASQTAQLGSASQSAATNCSTAIGGGVGAVGNVLATPTLNCPVAPLRAWRELPRGPR